MTHSTRYRMYVDESGDHVMDPSKWSSPDARYLGLTGVVIASDTYRTRTHPSSRPSSRNSSPTTLTTQ